MDNKENLTHMNGNDVISALWAWFEQEDQSQSTSSNTNYNADFSNSSKVVFDKKENFIKNESAPSNLIELAEPKKNLSNYDSIMDAHFNNEVGIGLDLDYCEMYKYFEREVLHKLESEQEWKTVLKVRRITDLGFEFYLCLYKWGQCILQKNERTLIFLKYLASLYIKYSNFQDKDDFDVIALYHKDTIRQSFTNLIPKEVSKSCYNIIVDEMCSSLNRICMEVDSSHDKISESSNLLNNLGNKNIPGKKGKKTFSPFFALKSNSNESQISNAKILSDLKYDYRMNDIDDPDLYNNMISKTFCRLVLLNKCSPSSLSKVSVEQWQCAKQKSHIDSRSITKLTDQEKKILEFISTTMAIGENFILIPQPCVEALDWFSNPDIRLRMNILPCNKYLFPSYSENPIDGKKLITEFCNNHFGANFPNSYITNNVRRYIGLLNIPENVCNLINDHCPVKHTLMDSLPCNLKSIFACRHSFFQAFWEKEKNQLERQSYSVTKEKHSLPVFVSEHLDPTSLVKTEMLTEDFVDDDEEI